jgi:Na+/H+ antiporter NhaD/arsenite permease-like protein
MKSRLPGFALFLLAVAAPALAWATGHGSSEGMPALAGIRLEFLFFGLTLLGVAVFHHHTLRVALTGLTVIVSYKLIFDPHFHLFEHFFGANGYLEQIVNKHARQGEWTILLNLFGLLVGFAVLARHFEESRVPEWLPKYLPDDWKGPLVLLCFVYVLSTFLDNIAGAMIGGTIALVVFNKKVHIGYIAAIVAASNAGGAGSVVGDTTTTMMWIDGVSALDVLPGFIASATALLAFAFFAARQQDRLQRIQKNETLEVRIDFGRLLIVVLMLAGTIATNVLFDFPALGVWLGILLGATFRKTPWHEARHAVGGSVFLLSLVTCASMMPVEELPAASWRSAFTLGFVSSVFDNIPLTKLALDQGCYDWGMLAYAVGFGGSMIWFGSSAGVAISNIFEEAKSVVAWLRSGWFVTVAYVIGFFVMLLVWGWHPQDTGHIQLKDCPAAAHGEVQGESGAR